MTSSVFQRLTIRLRIVGLTRGPQHACFWFCACWDGERRERSELGRVTMIEINSGICVAANSDGVLEKK